MPPSCVLIHYVVIAPGGSGRRKHFIDLAVGRGRRNFFNATEVGFEGEEEDQVDSRDLITEAEITVVITVDNTAKFDTLDPQK